MNHTRCSTSRCTRICLRGINKCKKHIGEYRCTDCVDSTCGKHCQYSGCGMYLCNGKQRNDMACKAHAGLVCRYCRNKDMWCGLHCSVRNCSNAMIHKSYTYYRHNTVLNHLKDIRKITIKLCKHHYLSECNRCHSYGKIRCVACAAGICEHCELEYAKYGLCIDCIVKNKHHYLYIIYHNTMNILNSVLPIYISNKIFKFAFCSITEHEVSRELRLSTTRKNRLSSVLEYTEFMSSIYNRIQAMYN